jgi:hypothetical protein
MANPNPRNQFQKGESGNPKGRPKRDWTWAGLMEEASEEALESGKTKKEILVDKIFELALKGDMMAIKEVFNRMDGLPAKSVDVTTGNEPLPVPIFGGLSMTNLIDKYSKS